MIDIAVVVKMVRKALLAVRCHFQSNDVRPTGRRSKLSEAARAECKRDLASWRAKGSRSEAISTREIVVTADESNRV